MIVHDATRYTLRATRFCPSNCCLGTTSLTRLRPSTCVSGFHRSHDFISFPPWADPPLAETTQSFIVNQTFVKIFDFFNRLEIRMSRPAIVRTTYRYVEGA